MDASGSGSSRTTTFRGKFERIRRPLGEGEDGADAKTRIGPRANAPIGHRGPSEADETRVAPLKWGVGL